MSIEALTPFEHPNVQGFVDIKKGRKFLQAVEYSTGLPLAAFLGNSIAEQNVFGAVFWSVNLLVFAGGPELLKRRIDRVLEKGYF